MQIKNDYFSHLWSFPQSSLFHNIKKLNPTEEVALLPWPWPFPWPLGQNLGLWTQQRLQGWGQGEWEVEMGCGGGEGSSTPALPQVTPLSASGGPMSGDSVVPVSQARRPRQTCLGVKLELSHFQTSPALPLLSDFKSELWTTLLRFEDSGS